VLHTVTTAPGEVVQNYSIPDGVWLSSFIQNELTSGRILELSSPDGILFHPLGLRPKSTGYRVIMDISRNRLNECMSPPSFTLQVLQKVFKLLRHLGPNCWIAKVDAKSAFRQLAIHPEDRWLFGFSHENRWFVELVMPMGARSSPTIWSSIFDAVGDITQQQELSQLGLPWPETLGVELFPSYVDDTIIIRDTEACAQHSLNLFKTNCDALGITLEPSKCLPPAQRMVVLGICFDTTTMTCSIPADKLTSITTRIHTILEKGTTTTAELDQLCGKLVWVCSILAPGKMFLGGLFNLLHSGQGQRPLSNEAKFELYFWKKVLPEWNGTEPIQRRSFHLATEFEIYIDACPSGAGGYCQNEWFSIEWPAELKHKHINTLELAACALALFLWLDKIPPYCSVIFRTDNTCAKGIWCKQSASNEINRSILRNMWQHCMSKNRWILVDRVPGNENLIADAFSRQRIDLGLQLLEQELSTHGLLPSSISRRILSSTDVLNFTIGSWSF
jgi:hypothetical protein